MESKAHLVYRTTSSPRLLRLTMWKEWKLPLTGIYATSAKCHTNATTSDAEFTTRRGETTTHPWLITKLAVCRFADSINCRTFSVLYPNPRTRSSRRMSTECFSISLIKEQLSQPSSGCAPPRGNEDSKEILLHSHPPTPLFSLCALECPGGTTLQETMLFCELENYVGNF